MSVSVADFSRVFLSFAFGRPSNEAAANRAADAPRPELVSDVRVDVVAARERRGARGAGGFGAGGGARVGAPDARPPAARQRERHARHAADRSRERRRSRVRRCAPRTLLQAEAHTPLALHSVRLLLLIA